MAFDLNDQPVLRYCDTETAVPRVLRGTGIAGLRGVGLVVRLVNMAVIARAIGLSGFGDVTTAIALAIVVALPLSLGFRASVFAHVPTYQADGDLTRIAAFRAYAVHQMRQVSFAALIAGLTATVALLLRGSGWWWLPTLAVMIGAAETFLNLEGEIVRARDRPVAAMLGVGVLPQLLLTPIVLTLWWAEAEAVQFVGAFAFAPMLSLLALRSVHILPNAPTSEESDRRRWASFRAPLMLAGAGQLVLAQAPVILLNALASSEQAGGYSAAYRLAALVTLIPGAMSSAMTPGITIHIGARRYPLASKDLRQLLSVNGFLVTVLIAGLWAIAGRLLAIFGPEFEGFVTEARILVVGLGIGAAMGPVSTLLIAFQRKHHVMVTYLSAALVFLIAMFAIPTSARSTAWMIAAAMSAQNIVQAFLLRRTWICARG